MGSQEPSERIAPEYQRSDGFDAAKLVRVGGTVLDPWQGDVLDDWMGFTPARPRRAAAYRARTAKAC